MSDAVPATDEYQDPHTDYFAYGSNLSLIQIARRCPGTEIIGRATLPDHRLIFPIQSGDWLGGVASIEPAAGRRVEGMIYRLNDAHLEALDEYEAVSEGLYRRESVTVITPEQGAVEAMTYIAAPDPEGPFAPSAQYLSTILSGAADHEFPQDYIDWLLSIETL